MAPKLSAKQWVLSHFVALGLLSLAVYAFFGLTERDLRMAFLDVGQGDAILIQTPERKTVLIDAGPNSAVIDRLGEEMNFFNKTIDLFILTHPDSDHYGGFLEVLKKYDVKQILTTGVVADSLIFKTFLEEVKRLNIPIVFPDGRDFQIGQTVFLDLVYPFKNQSFVGQNLEDRNDTSVSLRLRRWSSGGWENLVMLTGDAEAPQERELVLSGQDLSSTILKMGHHGSRTSSTPMLLNATRPQTVVVSAGKDNKFGHPHAEVMERVKHLEIHSTIEAGTVKFNF